jgi:hypothetical protein
MSTIYIKDCAHTEETSEVDPKDPWSRASTHTTHFIEGISLNEKTYESLDLDYTPEAGVLYFLLWATYGTGDSFGHDSGNIVFVDLFKTEVDAEECKHNLERASDYSITLKSASGKSYAFSVPWIGYFESLENVEIKKFKIGT